MNINELIIGTARPVATEALYYCFRALKQAMLSKESQKDYFHDTSNSKPSPEGIDLAKRIIGIISEAEKSDIDHLNSWQIQKYIQIVGEASEALVKNNPKIDLAKGAELLRRLRES